MAVLGGVQAAGCSSGNGGPEGGAPDQVVVDRDQGVGDVSSFDAMDAPVVDAPSDAAPTGEGGDANGDANGDAGANVEAGTGCGASELCFNGLDDDCDGMVDESCTCVPGSTQRCYIGPPAQAGVGACAFGSQQCTGAEIGTWGACTGSVPAASEACGNPVDENCNGIIDEGCECALGGMRPCYTGPAGSVGVGNCRAGTQSCEMTPGGTRWGTCVGQVLPEDNRCDGVDRLCRGNPNEGCICELGRVERCYGGPMETRNVGECHDGMRRCVLGPDMRPRWDPCVGEQLPAGPNACDGRDRACTGARMCCMEGEARACYMGPAMTAGVGLCRAGTQTCVRGPDGRNDFGACTGQVVPAGMNTCDGVDRECNRRVPAGCESCAGMPPQTCYSGPSMTMGVGRCRAGARTCAGTPPRFGACVGEVLPNATELCGNAIDDDCDGMVDEGCACSGPSECYSGPPETRRVGACRDGAYRCVTPAMGPSVYDRSVCVGQVLPVLEVCGNGIDDDCDGIVDCGCFGGESPWQVYRTAAPICYASTFAACGYPNEFDAIAMDRVPPRGDPAWVDWEDAQINFGTAAASPDRPTRLRPPCNARNGGDFTFFQTNFALEEDPLRPGFARAMDFRIRVTRVNNAIRATLYNSRYPNGASINTLFASSDLCDMANISGDTRVNMADLLAPGANRIVITHLDDAGPTRELSGVQLVLDGVVLTPCTMPTTPRP